MGLLELEAVTKHYRRGDESIVALAGVDLSVDAGESVALVGRSGSGKSTLLHLAGGIDLPDSGTVRVDGRDVPKMTIADRARLRRRDIGFVFQFFHLLPTLTVEENVELPLLLDGSRANGQARELLERVGLSHRLRHVPAQLSGGELQRAALARALVAKPRLLLADEPTGNLDSTTAASIMDLLRSLVTERGTALVLVTHDEMAAATAQRTLHLRDGALVEPPKPARRPRKARAAATR
jgi:predicted ABC-type transport system involved in lysophospholipase L1 biosynthesis ATPase subunit